MTDFLKKSQTQKVEVYLHEATTESMEVFAQRKPIPFLLYARSQLWDRTLIKSRSTEEITDESGATRMVKYEYHEGGMTFLHPIKKRQTDTSTPGIVLGRSANQDLVVPVGSVSSAHLTFTPPQAGGVPLWTVTDGGSRNGTWLNEEKLQPYEAKPINDGEYVRLGGNLIGWFLYPQRLWFLLNNPVELKKLTDLT